ncbi:MAG TPA: EAL domain-containing protein [Thermoleophilaceae bacterium]|nr:EAL domain-containing protein [Thermoleophilaceae bacterium]
MGSLLSRIIDEGLIKAVYQPLVDLYTGEVMGYEALARGPEGELERPDLMFAAARSEGRLAELDRACAYAAVAGAVEAGLQAPLTLFVNAEPEVAGGKRPEGAPTPQDLPRDLRLVIEVTERALASHPANLLPTIDELRSHGIGIALDDVGVDPRSLALMPFLRPDVIKLDLSLIQGRPSEAVAETHNAVSAYAERTGALVVAEGIETEEHAERARAMGASVGQGWLFGRPGPLPASLTQPRSRIPIFETEARATQTPYRSIEGRRPLRSGTKRLLLEISRELERQADALGEHAVLISTFQHARHFTPTQAALYEQMARRLAFVGALGEDMDPNPVDGVRGATLPSDDPLLREWDIVVVAPHFAAAFTALDQGDTGVSDMDRRFDFQLTYERELAVQAARSLMSRIEPVHGPAVGARATVVAGVNALSV